MRRTMRFWKRFTPPGRRTTWGQPCVALPRTSSLPSTRPTGRLRLWDFLDKYEVLAFAPLQVTKRDDGLACRVQYHYRHRQTGMEIDGSMRLLWSIAGDKATSLKVIHDAERMGVFFELADRCSRGELYM